jgi:hypothetical protein
MCPHLSGRCQFMNGEYTTKEMVFVPGCYRKVYHSSSKKWCWLVRLTTTTGKTYIQKCEEFPTKLLAEQSMVQYINGIEPILNQYHKKISSDWEYTHYNNAISKSMSYMYPITGLFRFVIKLKFWWCSLAHRKWHFHFRRDLEPPVYIDGVWYYNTYCSKCWCAREVHYKNYTPKN